MLLAGSLIAPGRRRADVPDPVVIPYLAIWLLAPTLGALVFSLSAYSIWGVPRYLFAAAPALVLWLGAAIGGLRRRAPARAIGLAARSRRIS